MHYRTPAVDFLEPPDAFLAALGAPVASLDGTEARVEDLLGPPGDPTVVLFAVPA
jgi:hypothetical protein